MSPCPTSVATMTQNVRYRIKGRWGNSGARASAAASDTTPRMPAQDTITTARGDGGGSLARIFALSQRGRYVAGNTHTNLATMTVRLTISPYRIRSAAGTDDSPAMIDGSCRPMTRNTNALIAQITICHAPLPKRRASGDSTRAARCPVMSPATTVASTPETPSDSAAT